MPDPFWQKTHQVLTDLTGNEALQNELQSGGEVFFSNAIVNGMYCLRACIVNFRTSKKDIEEVIDIITRKGAEVHIRIQD